MYPWFQEQLDRLQAEIIRLSRLREDDAMRLEQLEADLARLKRSRESSC